MSQIHYYFLAITVQISRTAPPKKHAFFQIDEFIMQLMTSEQFDELADVIADKAVQKIIKMNTQNNSHVSKEALRTLDKKENDPKSVKKSNFDQEQLNNHDGRSIENFNYDLEENKGTESRMDEKSNHNRDRNTDNDQIKTDNAKINYGREKNKGTDSEASEKSDYSHETQKDKYEKDNNKSIEKLRNDNKNSQKKTESISKIDTQKFLQKYMTSKELELNFKHLKGELKIHRFDVKGNNIKSNKGYDKNKRNEHTEYNRAVDKDEDDKTENAHIKKILKNIDSKEFLLSEGSNENKAHEQETFHDAENNIKHGKNSEENKSPNLSDTGNEVKRNIIFKYDQNSNEKPIPPMKKQNNSEGDIIANAKAFIDKIMDKVSEELNNSYSSKEVLEVGVNRARSYQPDEKISIYSGKSRDNLYASKTKDRIDETDEKPSNLQTSAEYAEYHGNSAIRPKPKFINTYKYKY